MAHKPDLPEFCIIYLAGIPMSLWGALKAVDIIYRLSSHCAEMDGGGVGFQSLILVYRVRQRWHGTLGSNPSGLALVEEVQSPGVQSWHMGPMLACGN